MSPQSDALTFARFLRAAADEPFLTRPEWADIGYSLRGDLDAPSTDAALHAYLLERIDEELVGQAFKAYRLAKAGRR